jgi:hypothetical protein
MATKMVQVEVSEKGYDLGIALKNIVAAAKQACDDGFQPGQDVPAILSAAVANLLPVMNNIKEIANEPIENPEAFTKALSIPVTEIGFLFYKKN